MAVVQIQEVRASGGGFQNYLGQTYDPAAKTWTETYGQQVGGDLCPHPLQPAPGGRLGAGHWPTRWRRPFLTGGPAGFAVEKWTLGGGRL